jgi:hypothetical protein
LQHGSPQTLAGVELSGDVGRQSQRSWPDTGGRKPHSAAPHDAASISFWHAGQYQGAGVFTGFGLRLRHLLHKYRLPLTAVLPRAFLPVLGKFFGIGTSVSGV